MTDLVDKGSASELEVRMCVCKILVAPSWNVFGSAPNIIENSGGFRLNRAIRTACAPEKARLKYKDHIQFI